MPYQFRHSICNEVFQDWSLADACQAIRRAGYAGIEIAPFTLAEDPAAIPAATRRQYRSTIESEGLEFAGLHWLLVSPKGLHVTTPDASLRERSWDYVRRLIDLCADLGPGGIMVFGSPKQRCSTGGLAPAEALKNFVDGLAGVGPHAAGRGVTLLIEALAEDQCDVVNTIDEAARIVRSIGNPGVRTMFDTHNAVNEVEPHATLVDRHFDLIRHIHINEMDGKHPGTGSYDFKPLLAVLKRRNFAGWVSLEAFDFSFGAEKIANDSLSYIQAQIAQLS